MRRFAAEALVLSVSTLLTATAHAETTTASTAGPAPVKSARIFFWGNSTVSHSGQPTSTPRTNIGVWLGELAAAAGVSGCEEGQSAPKLDPTMLGDDVYPAPAELEMNMALGRPCRAKTWAEADFDVGVLLDNNFRALDPRSGWGDVEGARRRVLAAMKAEPKLKRWFLYSTQHDLEPELYSFDSWKTIYQRAYLEAFHALQDRLNATALPVEVRLIPVGTILLDLFRKGGLLEDFSLKDAFLDDAPHQTESTALVMAATTFVAIHRQPLPESYVPPEGVDPRLRARWAKVRAYIWDRVLRTDLAPRVFGLPGRGAPPRYPPVPEAARSVAAPKKRCSCRVVSAEPPPAFLGLALGLLLSLRARRDRRRATPRRDGTTL